MVNDQNEIDVLMTCEEWHRKKKHMLIVAKRRKEGQRIKLMDAKSAFGGFFLSIYLMRDTYS